MPRQIDDTEKRAVVLRTSADVVAHCVLQLDCLANDWPQYAKNATDLRVMANAIISHAKEYGYLEKTRI